MPRYFLERALGDVSREEAPDTASLRQHAAESGLPIDRMYEMETDLVP
jgi:hypothetical protein